MAGYKYEEQKPTLFTDEGQRKFLQIRDHVQACLKMSGAVMMIEAIAKASGDVWEQLACVDRMVELGELLEVPNPFSSAGQHRLFIAGRG